LKLDEEGMMKVVLNPMILSGVTPSEGDKKRTAPNPNGKEPFN
jgi:hypothetical protein